VKLLYKGQTVVLRDGKTRSLNELDQLVKGGGKPGFMSRFWNFLSGSMQQTQDEKKLEEHHRRYMEEVYAGVKGFADPVYAIRSGLLYGNKLGGGPVTFRWSGGGENEALRLVVRGKGNVPVYSALVRGKACTIDLSQLALDGGTTGTWQLWPASDSIPKAYSPAVEFVYDPEGAQKSLAALLPDPDYQHAFPAEQLLMQAYVLEQAGFYYDAAQKYEASMAGNPQNALLRNARAAFLARMDMLEEAKSAMRE
jgi:hypothetical protein